jgi:S1-C subfamily serine protease
MSGSQELLRTTSLKGLSAARTGGSNAVEAYGRIIERIRQECGVDVATLFAEPALPANPEPDNPQLTWYTPLDGPMVELASIDEMARRSVVSRLRDRLQRLKSALEDPEIGPTVASWLYIPSANDLLSVGGNPVLINWGYLPQDVAASVTRRETHFADTVGRYVTDIPAPPFTPQEAASYSARVTRRTRQPAASVAAGGPAAMASASGSVPVPPGEPPSRFRAWAPLVATLIAAAILAFLLIPGVLVFPGQMASEDIVRHADLLRGDNRSLAERLRELESAAKERVCRLPNGQLMPLRAAPGQALPNGLAPTAPNPNLLPPSPEQIQIPSSPNAPPSSATSLTDLIDRAVVFVVGDVPGGTGLGSGFFVTKDRVVTNRHVIENFVAGTIKVTNKRMGRALRATVVATSPSDPGESGRVQDFAILAVEQDGKAVLRLGPSPQKSSAVVAAGYPGFLVRDDPGYQQLMRGDLTASPDNTVQTGVVIQKRGSDPVKLVTHSANLGRGNSGGPLLDLCGRVVGVNTAVKNEGMLATTANLAQDVTELQSFLSAHNVMPEVDEAQTSCPPAVAAVPPPANAPPPAAAAGPTPPQAGTPGQPLPQAPAPSTRK